MLKTSFLNKTPVLIKVVFFLLAMLLVCKVAAVFATEEFEFRNSIWGMTPEEVIANETGEFLEFNEEENLLIFKTKEPVYGMKAKVYYFFLNENNECFGLDENPLNAYYYSLQLINEQDTYSCKYYEIKDLLAEQYGEPNNIIERWINGKTLNDYESLEDAILKKGVFLMAIWKFENKTKGLYIENFYSNDLVIVIANTVQKN